MALDMHELEAEETEDGRSDHECPKCRTDKEVSVVVFPNSLWLCCDRCGKAHAHSAWSHPFPYTDEEIARREAFLDEFEIVEPDRD